MKQITISEIQNSIKQKSRAGCLEYEIAKMFNVSERSVFRILSKIKHIH